MSDFDKEAEREKLRRKYESEQEDRKTTQQMSELLLQGATMTSKHCDTCGDPIFRYEGTEFCPTCQQETGAAGAAGEPSESGGDAASPDESAQSAQDATAGSTPGDVATGGKTDDAAAAEPQAESVNGGEPTPEADATTSPSQHASAASRRAPPSQSEGAQGARSPTGAGGDRTASGRVERGQATAPPERNERSAGPQRRDAGDLGEARAALVRKLTRLAREAEETDDVARARDLLAATREAAEAVAALDRANR